MTPQIHPSAVIDDDVQIGAGTKIWHFCHISRGARIGDACTLGQNVFVGDGVRVGARVKIQNNVSVYAGVEVGDDVFIGPSVVFTNVKRPRAPIDQRGAFQPTVIESGATLGANATIVCGVTIGQGAFIGAGSVVTHDVPAFTQVQGNPARVVGSVDADGKPAQQKGRGPRDSAPHSLPPLTDENLPIAAQLQEAAAEVLRSGKLINGNAIEAFETEIARFLGAPHAIACSSGTDALLVALMALEIGPGDEVVTTPYSFFSTVECILRVGATPRFVDIDPDTFLIDTKKIEAALTPKTRAVLPVHLFGRAVDLSHHRDLLRSRGIALIEDAAQALGTQGDDGMIGGAADFTCFSFFPSKNLGGFGDAGLITSNSFELASRARRLIHHGAEKKYHHSLVGGNFRMDTLQAALLRVKLPLVDELIEKRRRNARAYATAFGEAGVVGTQLSTPGAPGPRHTFNQYVIRTKKRDELAARLQELGIPAAVYYPRPLHLQPAVQRLVTDIPPLPQAEGATRDSLALPVYPALNETDIKAIAREVMEFLRSF